jgi:hypothetical protein
MSSASPTQISHFGREFLAKNVRIHVVVAKICCVGIFDNLLCVNIFVSTLPLASLRWRVPRPLARPPAAGNPPPGPEAGSGPASRLLQSEREYVR